MAEKIKDNNKKYIALLVIAQACLDKNQTSKAEEILLKSFEAARTIENSSIKTYAFEKIALLYNKIGNRIKALDVLTLAVNEAQNIEGASAEEVSQYKALRELAVDFVDLGDFDQAIATAKEAGTSAEYAFSLIADKCLQKNNIPQALQAIDLIEDTGSKEWSSVKIALKYAEDQNFEPAFQSISQIETNEVKASGLAQLATKYPKSNANEQAKVKSLLIEAVEIARKLTNEYGRDVLLAEIVGRYAEVGEYEQAKMLVTGISDPINKANGLVNIAREYGKTGQSETASKFLDDAVLITKESDHGPEQDEMIQIILKSYGEIGLLDKAMALTKSIDFDQSQDDAFITMSSMYTQNKQYEDAIKAVQSISAHVILKPDAIAEIVNKLVNIKADRAAKILAQSHQIVETLKDNDYIDLRVRVNTDIAVKYVELKKYDPAITIVKNIKNTDDIIGAAVKMLLSFDKTNTVVDKKGEKFLSDIGDLTWKFF
jgi:tetratricopeptide (TPR) repeat protein